MAEQVDAADLKSVVRKDVPVRFRPSAPFTFFVLEGREIMKKAVLLTLLFLTACSGDLSQYTSASSDASAKTRMRACLVSEANTRFQAGTLFTQGVSATSEDMVDTCLQKLTLQSAGISEESQSTAATIIQNLKNFGTSN